MSALPTHDVYAHLPGLEAAALFCVILGSSRGPLSFPVGLGWACHPVGLGGGSLCEKHSPVPGCPVTEPPPSPLHCREQAFTLPVVPVLECPAWSSCFIFTPDTSPGKRLGEAALFISSALKRDYEPFWEWIKAIAPGMDLILGDFCFPLFLDLKS